MISKTGKFIFFLFTAFLLYGCKDDTTVTDIDGNVYQTVKIGNQVWMAENLKVTKYRNGNPIFHLPDTAEWRKTQDGAYSNYNNDPANAKVYGRLYNWHAVNDSRNIAPEGWHIPKPEEVETLINYLKGDTLAAAKLKVQGTEQWLRPNPGSTNESGFSALPGGYRHISGSFHTLRSNGYWWTTSTSYEMFAWSPRVFNLFADVDRDTPYMNYGLAVRCIKD